jgi:hypothetical protein
MTLTGGKKHVEKAWLHFISNQKQELPMVAMFVNGSGRTEHSL